MKFLLFSLFVLFMFQAPTHAEVVSEVLAPISNCHYVSDCETQFKKSKEFQDLVAAGKRVILVSDYRTNDEVVFDQSTSYSSTEINAGDPGAEVVTITLSGYLSASGYISGHKTYKQTYAPEEYKKNEEAAALALMKKIKEDLRLAELRRLAIECGKPKPSPLQVYTDKLRQLEDKLKNKTMFGLPTENRVLFLIDASGSIQETMNSSGESYLEHAVKQLEMIIPMLAPDQYFGVGFFSDKQPTMFNNGNQVLATPDNVKRALAFLRAKMNEARGSSEHLHATLEEAFRQAHFKSEPEKRYNSVYLFSDMELAQEGDMQKSEAYLKEEGANVNISLFGKKNVANAQKLSKLTNKGKILPGSDNTKFTPDEIKAIQQELADIRQKIKELSP